MSTLKPSYGSSSAFTTTGLQSLATSSTLVAGWASAVVDNTSVLSDDEIVSWIIKLGTSPSVNTMGECWLYEALNDTPTYPDTVTGSEGTVTLTSANVKYSGAIKFAGAMIFDATSSRLYYNTCRVAKVFDGSMPKKWGALFFHSSGVNLASSGNIVTRIPIQYQNV